ncbi:MAG: UPF0449 family protein [Planctomycetes bacterium]|nr:UPF0449 family protein [Planctomycetota bacterium]
MHYIRKASGIIFIASVAFVLGAICPDEWSPWVIPVSGVNSRKLAKEEKPEFDVALPSRLTNEDEFWEYWCDEWDAEGERFDREYELLLENTDAVDDLLVGGEDDANHPNPEPRTVDQILEDVRNSPSYRSAREESARRTEQWIEDRNLESEERLNISLEQARRARSFVLSDDFNAVLAPESINSRIAEFDDLFESIDFEERYELHRLQNPLDVDVLIRLGEMINGNVDVFKHGCELLRLSILQKLPKRRTAVLTALIGTVDTPEGLATMEEVVSSSAVETETRVLALNARFAVRPTPKFTSMSVLGDDKWLLTSAFRTSTPRMQLGSREMGGETTFTPENRDMVVSWYSVEQDVNFKAELLSFLAKWGAGDEIVQNLIANESLTSGSDEIVAASLSSLDPVQDRALLEQAIFSGNDSRANAAVMALRKLPPDMESDTLDFLMSIISNSTVSWIVKINTLLALQWIGGFLNERMFENIVEFRMAAVSRIVEFLRPGPNIESYVFTTSLQICSEFLNRSRGSPGITPIESEYIDFLLDGIGDTTNTSRWSASVQYSIKLIEGDCEPPFRTLDLIQTQIETGILSENMITRLLSHLKYVSAPKAQTQTIRIVELILFDNRNSAQLQKEAVDALFEMKDVPAAGTILDRAKSEHPVEAVRSHAQELTGD